MSNGLALSGGGLKIFAHMGVLKALEELSIKFDYVTGTSSGSVVAVLYSLGVKPRDMMKMISNKYSGLVKIRTNKVFRSAFKSLLNNDLTLNSLIDGARMEDLISGVLDGKSMMGDIDKNLAIVSCDTISTKEVVFMAKDFKFKNTNRTDYLLNAPIAKAVRASMSFPGVFTACDYEGYNLIDGGTVNNLPSKLLKDMGADKVLGASFKLNDYKPKDSIMDVALRTADIFSILNMSIAKQFVDISIELDIPDAGLLNVDNVNEVYNLGYSQTMQRREEILKIFK